MRAGSSSGSMVRSLGIEEWDGVARDYDRVSQVSRAHQEKFARVTELVLAERPAAVLDLGCGSGLLVRTLRESGFDGRLECLDGSSEMLALAERNVGDGACGFGLHDLSQPIPFPDASLGVVTAINVMFCLEDRGAFAREVDRVLLPAGLFVCVMPKPVTEGTGAFFREHFKGMTAIEATRESLRLLPTLPAAIRTSRFQSTLDRRHEQQGDTFMTREETEAVLRGARFSIERIEDIQANENWLFAARKSA